MVKMTSYVGHCSLYMKPRTTLAGCTASRFTVCTHVSLVLTSTTPQSLLKNRQICGGCCGNNLRLPHL